MLLDTSGLLLLIDGADHRHTVAQREFARARTPFTHSYVLAELVALADARRMPRILALELVEGLVKDGVVAVTWVDEALHELGVELLWDRPDKDYSLCDAVSFVLMRRRGETEALTTDHHFVQEGFVRLLGS